MNHRPVMIFLGVIILSLQAAAAVQVVTSTTDIKSIAEFIGGDRISVKSITTGKDNPHFVEVLPSYMLMVSKAALYLKIGLGLDFWADPIIDGSRNGRLVVADCSEGVEVLEKPSGPVDASMGDIHPQGNPHYWLDPRNGLIMARNIEKALVGIDPGNATFYEANLQKFERELETKIETWQKAAEPLKGLEIITYHNSWPYLGRFLGFKTAGFIEPKPGIEPTASHIAELIDLMKSRGIRVIGKEPYFADNAPRVIAARTGARIVDLPPSVGASAGVSDYLSLFDTLLSRLISALGKIP
jgi:zinc/manganese transport system substrate-binding protein